MLWTLCGIPLRPLRLCLLLLHYKVNIAGKIMLLHVTIIMLLHKCLEIIGFITSSVARLTCTIHTFIFQVVVCSYFAHHLNVFSMVLHEHLHTLEDKTSLLSLHTAAITHTGSHLVLTNYNQDQRTPHITLWDLHKGTVGLDFLF